MESAVTLLVAIQKKFSLDSWEKEKNPESNLKQKDGLKTCGVYRCWLFGDGYVAGQEEDVNLSKKRRDQKGFSKREVEAVKESGGELTRGQLLRCRVRYFSEGMALGSEDFVEGVFEENRESFGPTRMALT